MNKIFESILVIAGLQMTLGCAALFTGTTNDVTFQSTPPGAVVKVGAKEGVTPFTTSVAKSTKEVVVQFSGAEPQTVELERQMMGGFILMDILFTPGFGISGLLIDGSTSSFYKHAALVHLVRNREGVIEASAPPGQRATKEASAAP